MKYCAAITIICQSLLIASCAYNAKTNEPHFTPLGTAPHNMYEMIGVIAHDVKECLHNSCETKTAHDGHEESKFKSMSNEELEAHIKKQKAK